MAKHPFRGSELGGLGALGEHVGDPRRYSIDPKSGDLIQEGYPEKGLGPGKPSTRKVIEDERQQLRWIRSLVAPDDRVVITPKQIGTAKPERLDIGIENRTSILIVNMSDQDVWINTTGNNLGANRGYPLASNAPAGAFNGGSIAIDVSERTSFWGVAAAGAANLVVVIESAR